MRTPSESTNSPGGVIGHFLMEVVGPIDDSWRAHLATSAPFRRTVSCLEEERKAVDLKARQIEGFLQRIRRRLEKAEVEGIDADWVAEYEHGEPALTAQLDRCHRQGVEIDNEIAYLLDDQAYPDRWSVRDSVTFGVSVDMGISDALTELMGMRFMAEFGEALSDEGFLEDGALHCHAWQELGPLRTFDLVMALRVLKAGHHHRLGERRRAWRNVQQACAQMTAADKKQTVGWVDPCYNRLRPRLKMNGEVVIIIDQPGNDEYVPPVIEGLRVVLATGCRRTRGRTRSSKGRPARLRRRSRAGARGGDPPDGSGGDDGPGSDLLGRQLHTYPPAPSGRRIALRGTAHPFLMGVPR